MEERALTPIQQKAVSVRDILFSDATRKQLDMAVPKWLTVDRLLRVAYSSILKNPRLLDCTRESLLGAIIQCAQLGLEPVLGRAHLVPYNNSKKIGGKWVKVLECQMQPGYQGLVDLAERTDKFETVRAHVVYLKDTFDIEYGLNERLVHVPYRPDPEDPQDNRGMAIGAYTVWTRKTGAKAFTFMYAADIYKIREKSQAYQNALRKPDNKSAQDTPWITSPGEMMKKSAIKRHSKLEPASIEVLMAVELDNKVEAGEAVPMLNLGGGEIPDVRDLKEAESVEKTEVDLDTVNDFDMATEGLDKAQLITYLDKCAESYSLSVDGFKAMVINEGAMQGFILAFKKAIQAPEPDGRERELDRLFDKWNRSKGGFRNAILSNLDTVKAMSLERQATLQKKWEKCADLEEGKYGIAHGEIWPLIESQAPESGPGEEKGLNLDGHQGAPDQETMNYLNDMDEFLRILGKPAFNRVMMAKIDAEVDYIVRLPGDVKPEDRPTALRIMQLEVDGQNQD